MSRSTRRAIVKERPRNIKKSTLYWRHIRRVIKNKIKSYPWGHYLYYDCELKDQPPIELEDTLPDPRSVVNDYDYQDYIIDYEEKQPWNRSIYTEEEFLKYWRESRAKHRRK